MFNANVTFNDVAHAIQLALTPVFLLTGIAGILNVMAGRLARIIDRGRSLTELPGRTEATLTQLSLELNSLELRRHRASAAITACTTSALLTCVVIAVLFSEVLLDLRRRGWSCHLFRRRPSRVVGLWFLPGDLATPTGIPIPVGAEGER